MLMFRPPEGRPPFLHHRAQIHSGGPFGKRLTKAMQGEFFKDFKGVCLADRAAVIQLGQGVFANKDGVGPATGLGVLRSGSFPGTASR